MAKSIRKSGAAVTAKDVAERAGVSPMTVSRVMNDEKNVKKETRDAVLAAVRELRYAPNLAAKSLASADGARFGLIYANPSAAYLSEFLLGMLDEAPSAGAQMTLVQCEAGDPDSERGAVEQLLADNAAGLLLPPPLSESAVVRESAAEAGVPVIAVATGRFEGGVSCIRIDDRRASFEMTRHLIDLGHTHIGFIAGHPNQSSSAERKAGFEAAMKQLAPTGKATIAQGYFNYQSGLEAAEKLIVRKDRPTAIFASNDDMAAAAVSVAHRRGLDVPEDISIVGFDDTAIATTIWPQLTTVRQPIREMASRAVDELARAIRARRDGHVETPAEIIMEHALKMRQSTAAPAAARKPAKQ